MDGGDDGGLDPDSGVPNYDIVFGSALGNFSGLFGSGNPSNRPLDLVVGRRGSGELLNHSIWLQHREIFMTCQQNACVNYMAGGNLGSHFRGVLYIIAMTKVEEPRFMLDVDTGDLSLAIDGLIKYHKKSLDPLAYLSSPQLPKKVTGVKVSAKEPFFEEVEVPFKHPIFTTGAVSKVKKSCVSTADLRQQDEGRGLWTTFIIGQLYRRTFCSCCVPPSIARRWCDSHAERGC